MIVERCVRCKERIEKEVDENIKMFNCPRCQVMVANPHYIKQMEVLKMQGEEPKKKKGPYTLTCSSCGAVKLAGKARWEKWKDTPYLCRECRKKQKEENK